jgi:methyl-accepting chemotaxis protein
MKNLKAWQKLGLIGALWMVPFAIVTYRMASSINTLGVEFAQQEIRGLEYYTPLTTLLKDLQLHRSLTALSFSGDPNAKGSLATTRAQVESDITTLDEIDRRLDGALHTTAKWTAVRLAIRDLLDKTQNLSAEDNSTRQTNLIGEVVALIAYVGDVSNLTRDPDLDKTHLIDVLISQGPELGEALASARGFGVTIAVTKNPTPDQTKRLDRDSILVEILASKMDQTMSKAFQANEALRASLETYSDLSGDTVLESMIAMVTLAHQSGASSATEYFATMTKGVDAIFKMEAEVTKSLHALLLDRVAAFRFEVRQALAWAALGLLVVTVIGVFAIRDLTRSLGRVVNAANQIAVGDLAIPGAAKSRKDEIGVLGHAFDQMVTASKDMAGVAERIAAGDLAVVVRPRSERDVLGNALANMVDRLSTLVGEMQRSGGQVERSAVDIAATAKQQQATASEIAATTTEISSTSREISATSKELVKTMSEISAVADQTATLAGSGQQALSLMTGTMGKVMEAAGSVNAKLAVLNQEAANINQVVTTITKVADQTNLLSLNAAIEAEKAGEFGRGFAVVATEIRRLADQTGVATYDIAETVKRIQSAVSAGVMGMEKFSEEVRRGMQQVQQVGDQLTQIIQQVQVLAPRFEAVNEGMHAHALGAGQITEALAQLSQTVEQTVESLRQSNEVIDGLNQAATGMLSGASRFTVAA